MDALSSIAEIIRDLLIFVVAMTALLIAVIVIVSKLPSDNPLKRVLTALSYRLAATASSDTTFDNEGRGVPGKVRVYTRVEGQPTVARTAEAP